MSDSDKDGCACITCAINKFVNERYPRGLDGRDAAELMIGIARLAGAILSRCGGDLSRDAFIKAVDGYRHETTRKNAPHRVLQ